MRYYRETPNGKDEFEGSVDEIISLLDYIDTDTLDIDLLIDE